MVAGKPKDELPPDFIEEAKVTSGRKVKVYTKLSTGSKFYSRPSVTRLESLGDIDYASGQNEPELSSKANEVSIHEMEEKNSSEMSEFKPDLLYKADVASFDEEEGKGNSSKMVTIECKPADGLPAGWMKEIKTTKSGNNKIRKDSFYVDLVSGYMFRSFQDALRYLETNDIKKCTCRPIRKKYDVKLSEDAGIQSTQVNEKLSGPIEIVGASSSPKELEASSGAVNLKKHSGGSPEKNPEMVNNPELAKEVAESDVGLMTDDTNQKFPENGMEIETSGSVRKTKKRMNPSVLLRSSKRLQGSEPEIPSGSNLKERALRSAVKRSPGRETNISLL